MKWPEFWVEKKGTRVTVNQTFQCAALKAWRPSWPMISAAAKRQAPFHHLSALPTYLLMATPLDLVYETPLPSVLDDNDTDQLLEKLRLVYIAARRPARLPVSST
jgi:hypothetical protein